MSLQLIMFLLTRGMIMAKLFSPHLITICLDVLFNAEACIPAGNIPLPMLCFAYAAAPHLDELQGPYVLSQGPIHPGPGLPDGYTPSPNLEL